MDEALGQRGLACVLNDTSALLVSWEGGVDDEESGLAAYTLAVTRRSGAAVEAAFEPLEIDAARSHRSLRCAPMLVWGRGA